MFYNLGFRNVFDAVGQLQLATGVGGPELGRVMPLNMPIPELNGNILSWDAVAANANGHTPIAYRVYAFNQATLPINLDILRPMNNSYLASHLATAVATVPAGAETEFSFNILTGFAARLPAGTYYFRVQAIAAPRVGRVVTANDAAGNAQLPAANSLISWPLLEAVVQAPPPPPPPGVGVGAAAPPQVPVEEPGDDTIGLPTAEVEYIAVEPEVVQAADEAVAAVAEAAAAVSGATIVSVAPPIFVEVELAYTVATVTMPEGVDTSEITTMAILNPDGTLTAVPTRIDADGNVVVLVREDAILVALNVQAAFIDIGGLASHVIAEINEAASLKIIEGRGGGVFDPLAGVTGREAVTMFLRAIGVQTSYRTSVATATANGFVGGNFNGALLMTRVEAARLIVSILDDMGLVPELTQEEIDELLADFADLYYLTDAERFIMAVVVKNGIFHGVGGGHMLPFDIVTRSQMASLAVRTQDVILLDHWSTLREWS